MAETNCACSPELVDLAFRESEPYIDQQIADRSYRLNRFFVDYTPVQTFPDGVGYELSKVRFYGDIGPQYDGHDGWRKEQRSRPASSHEDSHDACGYVWEEVGHGFEELHFYSMERDLKTVPICINDIRTFWQFKQYQNLIFNNLTEITAHMKEQLVRNSLINYTVKQVPTADGLQANPHNPYELPNVNGLEVGKLNFRLLKRLYNTLLREAGQFALSNVNGRPVFGLIGSDDVLDDMFLEDPEVRQDIRSLASGGDSSKANLLERYNFFEGVRNMFINIPDIFAPRFKVDSAGNLIRVFPYERGVVIQSGTRPAPNPEYENAPYELVIILTKDPFLLRSRAQINSVGGNTSFGDTASMFQWKWHNPPRWCDPNRRIGYYYANANVAVEPGDFTDMPSILVKRRPQALDTIYWPVSSDPAAQGALTNVLGAQGCPCPQVVDVLPLLSDANSLQFRFSEDVTDHVDTGNLSLRLKSGGVVTGAITLETGGELGVIDFGEPVDAKANLYVEVVCNQASLLCKSDVVTDMVNATTPTYRDLRVKQLIRDEVVVTNVLSVELEDGSYVGATLQAIDLDSLTYTVSPVVAGSFDGHCIKKLCVPTAIVSDCPACDPQPIACDPVNGLP